MYSVPSTTAGDDDTIESLVDPDQSGGQFRRPHPAAEYAITCAVFFPTYTTPLATIGDERIAATNPLPTPIQLGWH
jgi:hypothetical protein